MLVSSFCLPQGTAKIFEPGSGLLSFDEAVRSLNKYTTTLHAINSAVIKLGKLTIADKVFRGISGMGLPTKFWIANKFKVRGGVENGFMSTTLQREVAMSYAASGGDKMGIVFEVQMGMVNRGANLSWLSQYPHEQEILFGPLTGIEVLRVRIEGSVVVIECGLSINLSSLTLEQVLGKRKKLLSDMGTAMVAEVRGPLTAFGEEAAAASISALREELECTVLKQDAEWYNDDANFEGTVSSIMSLKRNVLSDADRLSLDNEEVDLTGWSLSEPGRLNKLRAWWRAGPQATAIKCALPPTTMCPA